MFDFFGVPLNVGDEVVINDYEFFIKAKVLKITSKMLHIEKYNKHKTKKYVYPKQVISVEKMKKHQPELFL